MNFEDIKIGDVLIHKAGPPKIKSVVLEKSRNGFTLSRPYLKIPSHINTSKAYNMDRVFAQYFVLDKKRHSIKKLMKYILS